jgi:O-antigen ligase
LADFNAATVLSDRATQTNESAIGSRWALLPELWSSILDAPLLGSGFGKTVTYYSSDPRVLLNNPTGEYTTYAFEWGWLDIWLKLGLLGLISYLWLIVMQIIKIGRFRGEFKPLSRLSLLAILATLTTVHIFTPYINHPLGIGMILLAIVFISEPKDLPELLR